MTASTADTTEMVQDTVDANQVRAQTGLIGLLITIFSATSFARAIQRMYERVWDGATSAASPGCGARSCG